MTSPERSDAPFSTQLPVRPRHCDAQGKLHAARFYEYFEEAFLRWLSSISLPYAALRQSGVDLVIVESGCVHHHPARLDDDLELTVVPRATSSSKALHISFELRHQGTLVAEGSSTYVAVSAGHAAELPHPLREATADTPQGTLSRRGAVNLLRQLHEAQQGFYAGGSREPLEAVLASDVIWHVPGSSPIAGIYKGRDEVVRYMKARRDIAASTFQMHPGEVLVGEDHIACLTDGTVERDGQRERWSTLGLYRVRGAQIAETHLLPFDQQQFDRIWSVPGSG
jgi:YbgC/YbaW family acyl-CoA thioester hydrolase